MNSTNRAAIIVISAGFLSRLLFYGMRQLHTDELMQALAARSNSIAEMLDRLRGGIILPAPLDYVAQWCIVLVFGESTWALRLHAVIFGSLSIWMFYRLACFLFNERVAVYSTLLFAVFPLNYHCSQEGQPYALFLLLTLASYYLFLRVLCGQERGWLKLAGILVLLLYASFLGVLVAASQLAFLVAARAGGATRISSAPHAFFEVDTLLSRIPARKMVLYLVALLVAFLSFLPWAWFVWHKPLIATVSEIITPRTLIRIAKELGDGSYPVSALVFLGAVTGFRALRRHDRRNVLLWLMMWCGISLPLVLLLDAWLGCPFAIHQVLHSTPPLILIAGYGLSYIGEQLTILDRLPHKISAPSVVYAAVLFLFSAWIAQSHWRQEPMDWRGTAQFLADTVRNGDAVTMASLAPLIGYYAPSLYKYRSAEWDPGPGQLANGSASRRIVVCANGLLKGPSAMFRTAAGKDNAWRRFERRGFMIFIRER